MSDQNNRTVIEQAYAAFLRGDIPTLLNTFADDIRFEIPGPSEAPLARLWQGRSGMQEFFATLNRELEFTEFSPREYIAQGDQVVAVGHYAGRVKTTGNTFFSEWVMVWRLRNGKAVQFREYNDTLAWAEAYHVVVRAAAV